MSKLALIFFFLCTAACAAECTVRHVSGNFAYDIDGQTDTRPQTWGRAGVQTTTLTFHPPAGQRVRILRIVGDLTARWRGGRAEGLYTGVLAAIHKPESSGSQYADWAADGHFVYVQGDIGSTGVVRVPFKQSFEISDPGALLETPALIFKFAKYLDETPYSTHAEITFSQIDFCFEGPK